MLPRGVVTYLVGTIPVADGALTAHTGQPDLAAMLKGMPATPPR